jgi:hypothetical protein
MRAHRYTLALAFVFLAVFLQRLRRRCVTPPQIWKDYDPNKGDFKEEIVNKRPRTAAITASRTSALT